ncbi:MAG: PucR family transcriptional regulator [Nocardioidaceae bacterium]
MLAGSDPQAFAQHGATDELVVEGRFRPERFAAGIHEAAGVSLAVARMLAGRADHVRLVVVRRSGRFGRDDLPLLDLAANVAALVMTKTRAVQMVEAKYRGDFVREVLQGRAGPADGVASHFEALGWSGVMLRHDRTAPVVGFAQEVVALVPVPPGADVRETVGALVRAGGGDGGGGRHTFATGVSRVVGDPAGIPAAYEQARRAEHVGRQLQGTSSVSFFDDLGAFRLLSLIEDESELRNFVREVLHELADPDLQLDLALVLRVMQIRGL